jgi:DNA-binding CsgD family transcriptional regulator
MSTGDALRDGRRAFRARAWAEAYARLSAAQQSEQFETGDLERFAASAYLSGHDDASAEAWTRAHREWLRANDTRRAVRCAFWLVMQLLSAREVARAGGWLTTAQRLLEGCDPDCAERGLFFVLASRGHLRDGNLPAAHDASRRAMQLGDRCADADLTAFARLVHGLTLASQGDHAGAAALFDEAMVAVTVAEVAPITVGTVYCAVIEACYELVDIGRAREWTDALSRWCGSQPDLVAFRGHCLVHRAETLRFCGSWSAALAEASRACGRPSQEAPGRDDDVHESPRGYPIGAAFYETAEIHRMRGEFAEAEDAYREASRYGRTPEPGLALLRLAQGRQRVAEASIRRALAESRRRFGRACVLAACVEIMVAGRDLRAARGAADELATMAGATPVQFLRAVSAQSLGSVLLAEGESPAALAALRGAWVDWQALEMPYEAAKVRVLMALACRALEDEDAAGMELDAAQRVFARLGAAPDVARVDRLLGRRVAARLTPRETEVMRLVATGRSNRAIARALAISERTVDRHVSNILTKLDLSSRTAATAYAYEHGLV